MDLQRLGDHDHAGLSGAVLDRRYERERPAAAGRGDRLLVDSPLVHLGRGGDVLRVDLGESVAEGGHDYGGAADAVLGAVSGLSFPGHGVRGKVGRDGRGVAVRRGDFHRAKDSRRDRPRSCAASFRRWDSR